MTYTAGSSFGDIALTNQSRTRQATVRAEDQCVIASLEQAYYNKCLQKLHQKRLNKTVDFLMGLDCFQAHSKNAVIKFYYCIEKLKMKRNQKLYIDGKPANKIYIVQKGEFEVQAKLAHKNIKNVERINRMMGLKTVKRDIQQSQNILAQKFPEVEDLPNVHKLSIYGPGCLIGEEDVLYSTTYSCTVSCYSTKGVVFAINKEDFIKLLSLEKSLEAVKKGVRHKNEHKQGQDLPRVKLASQSPVRIQMFGAQVSDISTLDP